MAIIHSDWEYDNLRSNVQSVAYLQTLGNALTTVVDTAQEQGRRIETHNNSILQLQNEVSSLKTLMDNLLTSLDGRVCGDYSAPATSVEMGEAWTATGDPGPSRRTTSETYEMLGIAPSPHRPDSAPNLTNNPESNIVRSVNFNAPLRDSSWSSRSAW